MYSMVGHQPATIQTIALGAREDGRLTGIRHESISPTSVFDDYIEYAALCTRSLWGASGGISTNHKVVHVNRNTPTPLRSPHEALGHFALESAMDELAYATGIDPVALRLLNDTAIDPHSGRPFSTRAMRACLTAGAARFGWDKRTPQPRSMRDGRYLIGQGMAGAIYTHWRWPAKARVTLKRDGSALVETGTHDLGTGTYTVMQQVAADTLGLAPDKVIVRLGDTRLPASHASIGSATVANAGASGMLGRQAPRDRASGPYSSSQRPVRCGAVPSTATMPAPSCRRMRIPPRSTPSAWGSSRRKRARSAPGAWAGSPPYLWRRRLGMPCITRPASECGTCRSPWRSCCEARRKRQAEPFVATVVKAVNRSECSRDSAAESTTLLSVAGG